MRSVLQLRSHYSRVHENEARRQTQYGDQFRPPSLTNCTIDSVLYVTAELSMIHLRKKQMLKVIWQKNAASPPHMDGSIVFARLRQCAPHITHAFLGPPKSIAQTASRSVVPILYNGPPLSHSELPLRMGDLDPWAHPRVHNPNGISIGSAVFAVLTIVTCRQTDRPYYSVCNKRPRIHV